MAGYLPRLRRYRHVARRFLLKAGFSVTGSPGGLGFRISPFFDFFLPQVCILCGREGIENGRLPVCASCLADMTPVTPLVCECCGTPFEKSSGTSHLCASCLTKTPPFDRSISLYTYAGKTRELIHHLKFRGNLSAVSVINHLLPAAIKRWSLPTVDLAVPVPLSRDGLRDRGYNQALLIAQKAAALLKCGVDRSHFVKIKKTKPQIGLTKSQRKKNLLGVFAVSNARVFRGKSILLVDDVYTTGATVAEGAKTLSRAGAASVIVLTFARTVAL